jgi:type II secretory ATPase GspE/PulE/Tfp pilus assembly ATPase PilB-like protein
MTPANIADLSRRLETLPVADPNYAIRFVDVLLDAACLSHASDIHVQPTPRGLEIRWRLDGVLQTLGVFPRGESTDVVARLKVLAELLTYRTDVPQEGRLRERHSNVEIRVSTFPTLHGERAVIRLFAAQGRFVYLDDLQLPGDLTSDLRRALAETSGAIVICGPAGSGKTTTAYACLREIVRGSEGGMSIVSLEDPIEVAVDGVAQSQVNPAAGFDHAAGLRSLMRQDPEVILVGEIRDRETAGAALQAALTGHLVLTTFHSGSAAGAIGRLLDMDIEPFQLRNGIAAVLCQRLVRRLCTCSQPTSDDSEKLQLPVKQAQRAVGCENCLRTGYAGRLLLAEFLPVQQPDIAHAILAGSDIRQLSAAAAATGMIDFTRRAVQAVEAGLTSPTEIRRVLGFGGFVTT